MRLTKTIKNTFVKCAGSWVKQQQRNAKYWIVETERQKWKYLWKNKSKHTHTHSPKQTNPESNPTKKHTDTQRRTNWDLNQFLFCRVAYTHRVNGEISLDFFIVFRFRNFVLYRKCTHNVHVFFVHTLPFIPFHSILYLVTLHFRRYCFMKFPFYSGQIRLGWSLFGIPSLCSFAFLHSFIHSCSFAWFFAVFWYNHFLVIKLLAIFLSFVCVKNVLAMSLNGKTSESVFSAVLPIIFFFHDSQANSFHFQPPIRKFHFFAHVVMAVQIVRFTILRRDTMVAQLCACVAAV